jgi:hypothetical protein
LQGVAPVQDDEQVRVDGLHAMPTGQSPGPLQPQKPSDVQA